MLLRLKLSRMILAIILAVVIKGVDGNEKIVQVSELLNDGKDYSEDERCCVYGNCSCSSLDHALANLTSNVLINITTDVTLSSLVTVSDLENVSIIGHNNPTVNCRNVSEMQFTFSRHLIIQGITWIGCGTDNINHTKPGLSLSHSFNVTIQNCTFQQSVGQAIVLSEMSGDVNINNCKFVNNSHYRGHGAAIHYSSNDTRNSRQVVISISDCNFSYNKMINLIYFENRLFKYNKITFSNSVFDSNQGTSIYAINCNISLNGKILFLNNTAENGVGIYISDHSTVTFVNNSEVTFIQNSAKFKGGAVFLRNHSSIIFDKNSIVTFIDNCATNGTVYSETRSNVTFKGNCHVTFSNNSAIRHGAAIYSDNSHVTFTKNSNATFSSNYVYTDDTLRCISVYYAYDHHGGSIYSINFSEITFEGSTTTLFNNNTADYGGAIYSFNHSHLSFEGNSNTTFSNNIACRGGAIYHINYGSVTFKGNANMMFINNTAVLRGGAIKLTANVNMSFQGKCFARFTDNSAYYGGAIHHRNYCSVSIKGNSTLVFSNNTAGRFGGAIDSYINSNVFFGGNSTTLLNNNTAAEYGGALYSYYYSSVFFERNCTIVFNDNMADRGGAIYSYYYRNISFEGDYPILFNNNTADRGGAIYCVYYGNVSFEGNSTTKFNDNTADQGGAILSYFYGSYISFKENSTAEFNNNIADRGGAIFTYYHSSILFTGISTTVFRNNAAYNKGGAMILDNSKLAFDYFSIVNFTNNKAIIDATIYSTGTSVPDQIIVQEVGNPTITFNDRLVNWCDITCLSDGNHTEHQIDEDFAIAINSNGTVRCSGDENTLVSLSRKCGFKYLEDRLANLTSNELVSISDNVIISSVIFLTKLTNISIIGSKDHSITCINNAGLQLERCSNITIKGLNWVGCGADTTPVINILNTTDITLQNCLFQQSKGPGVVMFALSGYVNINHCQFIKNTAYRGHGAAVHYSSDTTSSLVINNCNFTHNEGATSLVYINGQTEDTNISLCNSSFHNNHGISVYLSSNTLHIKWEVLFENNVAENGTGIYINNFSKVIFDKNSKVKFTNNSVHRSGAAILLNNYSSVLFDHNSVVTFGNNSATQYGAAIYSSGNSHVTFTGNSNICFDNNFYRQFPYNIYRQFTYFDGLGTVYSEQHSSVSFEKILQ